MALAVPKKLVLLSAISGKLTFFEFFPWPLLLITGLGPILSKLQIFYLASVVCFYELLLCKYLCWIIGLLPYFINLCSTCSLLVLGYFVSCVCRITLRLTLCELISCITVSSITCTVIPSKFSQLSVTEATCCLDFIKSTELGTTSCMNLT